MKKTLQILFTLLYLSFTIGITTTTTYCVGNSHQQSMAFTDISVSATCECCCCGECETSCCVSETETIKIVDAYNFVSNDIGFSKELSAKLNESSVKELMNDVDKYFTKETHHLVPSDISLYLITSQFLI